MELPDLASTDLPGRRPAASTDLPGCMSMHLPEPAPAEWRTSTELPAVAADSVRPWPEDGPPMAEALPFSVEDLPPPKGLRPDTGNGLTVEHLPRRQASIETNIARKGVWTVGHVQLAMPVDGYDILGLVKASGPALTLTDLDTFAWLCERWREGDRDASGRVSFTLYELGMDLYGRDPGGEERRLMRASMRRLFKASFELEGYVASEKAMGALGDTNETWIRLVAEVRWQRRNGTERNVAQLGGFIVEQLQAGHLTYLDWRVLRSLDGLAKRLWVYLESQTFKRSGVGEGSIRLWLGPPIYQALGITTRHPTQARQILMRAGEKISAVDRSFVRFDLHRPVRRGGTWSLTARRRLSGR